MKKLLLCLLICSLSIVSLSIVSASEYTEVYDLNNSWIDGTRDSKYELLYNSTSEQIWFAHSSTRYAFYIESNTTLSSVAINSTNLSGDFSDANVIAKFIQNRSEIVIQKAYLGEKIAFGIVINSGNLIVLDPFGALIPPPIDTTTTTDTSTNTTTNTTTNNSTRGNFVIDFISIGKNLFSSWIFWMCVTLIILIAADYNNHPIVKVMDKSGKLVRIGRFITETDEPKLNKKKFIILGLSGVREVYCDFSFRSLDIFCWQRVYVIEWDYPHLILATLQVPEKSDFKKKDYVKDWRNNLKWKLFKIIGITPFRFLALQIYYSIKFKESNTKEVDYLIPFHNMDSIEYRFDIEYEQEELNTSTSQYEYIKKDQKDVIYSDIIALRKSKIQNLNIKLKEVRNIHYPTLKEALEDKHSRFETVNAYENQTTALEVRIFDLEKRLQNSYYTIQKQRLETDEKIRDGLKPYEESAEHLRQNIPNLLTKTLKFRDLIPSEEKAIEKAILEFMDESDEEKRKLKEDNIRLQAKLEKSNSKSKSNSFNPNEIIITDKDKKGDTNDE